MRLLSIGYAIASISSTLLTQVIHFPHKYNFLDGGDSLKSVEFFTSHEGLILNYEEALTAKANNRGAF